MGDIEIKIAHCADLHIGSSSNTSEILKSFYNLIEICTNPDINILLISGDLFDSLDVSQDDLNIVKNELKNIKIPVYISPGNHDPYISNTIYDTEWPENVYIFKSSKINFFEIPEHKTRIYGAGFSDIYELESLFEADNNLDKNYINICTIHGDIYNSQSKLYNNISLNDIKNSNFDYIALGHIHKRTEPQKIGNTWYAYSGSIMSMGSDEIGNKGIYVGTISKNRCDLEFQKTCYCTHEKVHIDATNAHNHDEIAQKIVDFISKFDNSKQNFYEIYIIGELPEDLILNTDYIKNILIKDFYRIKIYDETHVKIDIEKLRYRKDLQGMFVNKLLNKIENTENTDEQKLYQEALKIGLRAFDNEVFCDGN